VNATIQDILISNFNFFVTQQTMSSEEEDTLGFLQGVRQVVHILRHIESETELNMLGRLIPYGGGGEVPLDRLGELAARMTREQFGDLMRLQSRPDTDDEQSVRDRKLVAEHLCEELACSGVSVFFFFFFFFFFFLCFLLFFLYEQRIGSICANFAIARTG
jgi:hypothetical protein